MGRILAIDYGEKRCGIAVTDSLKIIANGLQTVDTKNLMDFLKNYFQKENVETVVIGEPKRMNNQPSFITPKIEKFILELSQAFPNIKIERMDERFTSKMAFQTMIDAGLKKKDRQNKALVDTISATIILQSYLESKSF
ncbi:MAG: Holliday junction resolvase RuvX [Bacteroidia bacterium]